jgi:hypothetical protein
MFSCKGEKVRLMFKSWHINTIMAKMVYFDQSLKACYRYMVDLVGKDQRN